jgi:RimJ/RimL family protein N-acetyltransferase
MLRTGQGNSWLLRQDLPVEMASELEQALAGEPVVVDFERTPPHVALVRKVLARQAPPAREYRGPAFVFPDALPHAEAAEMITEPDDPRFRGAFAWVRDTGVSEQPIAARFADDVAVAVCHSACSSARVAEAGLETDPAHRRQGHAIAVTTAWAAAVRSEGRVPLYGTSWENGASRAVARRLGLVLYGEDWHID